MKTHLEVLEKTEREFLDALKSRDWETLQYIMHPDFLYNSDSGEVFISVGNIPIFNPELITIDSIEIVDRHVNLYNNVAIVLTLEQRSGLYRGIAYDNKYRHTRVWKFNGKRWIIISAITYLL